ncbi:chromosome partition protein Smc-like [Ptychodera flava]|uniref:chromosome partition protein Smc-like n=1 Tax=Ptychodera flava TaxID=63121 RepID=UPI00396A2495
MNSCRVFNHAPDDSELRIVELTRQLEEADLYNKKLETIFYDVEEARVNSQIRAENLEREKGHLEISLREANQENERLRGKLQTVSSSLSDLRESSTKEKLISRDENAILIEEKGRLEERVMKLMKSMKLKEDNYKQKDSYIKDLENITDTLGKELECFQRQVKNLRSILEKQNKEKHFLREELSKTELLKQNYRSLEKKNRQLEQDNQIMKSLLKAADDKLISMETMQIDKETRDEELKEGFSKTITELADVYNNWSDDTIQIPNLTRTEQ